MSIMSTILACPSCGREERLQRGCCTRAIAELRAELAAAKARIEFLEHAYHRCAVCRKPFADDDAILEPHCDDCALTTATIDRWDEEMAKHLTRIATDEETRGATHKSISQPMSTPSESTGASEGNKR